LSGSNGATDKANNTGARNQIHGGVKNLYFFFLVAETAYLNPKGAFLHQWVEKYSKTL